jgi:hypothetical protein
MDFKSRILHVFTVIIFDVFLQRRLFRQSARRWLIHSLIFWPFVFRFAWGMTALLMSLWDPGSSIPWTMLDRNYPLGAFLFDFSGLMILSGVILTFFRKMDGRSEDIGGFPRRDWPALSLLGGIVVIGFILEGIRIAMTGGPPGLVPACCHNRCFGGLPPVQQSASRYNGAGRHGHQCRVANR